MVKHDQKLIYCFYKLRNLKFWILPSQVFIARECLISLSLSKSCTVKICFSSVAMAFNSLYSTWVPIPIENIFEILFSLAASTAVDTGTFDLPSVITITILGTLSLLPFRLRKLVVRIYLKELCINIYYFWFLLYP